MMIRILALCVFSALFLLMAGCTQTGGPSNGTGMPNPASVYCEQHGGSVEITTDSSGGQSGTCKFPNGGQCDEWAYYRGECDSTSSCACTYEYVPVCGADGTTYGNKCAAKCAGVAIASQGECGTNQTNSTSNGTSGTGDDGSGTDGAGDDDPNGTGNPDGGVGMANPASVYCIEHGGTLEILDSDAGQYGMCTLPGGAECEEWAYFRGECGNATTPGNTTAQNLCDSTADCACGVHKTTGQCFYGNKYYVDTSRQCPDFCTGIAAHLEIACIQNHCQQVGAIRDFEHCTALNGSVIMESHPRQCRAADGRVFVEKTANNCTSFGVDSCPEGCVVCPPCAECSSIGCQSGQFCESIGFNSTWYDGMHDGLE